MTEFEDAELTRWYLAQQEAMSSLRDDVATSPATLARALDPEYRIRPHIRAIADAFLELRDHDQGKEGYDRILITTPPQIGKFCSDDTPVRTPSGWIRHGDLRVGDEVTHPSGKPTRVVAVHDPDMASMVVRTQSGAGITVHPRHEWTVYDQHRHVWDTVETQDLARGEPAQYQLPSSVVRQHDAITSVERCEPRPGRCITVAADDGLYLVGEHMVPTHNSVTAAVWAPLWWLIHHPRHRIVVSSYSGLLAMKRGRAVRDLIADQGSRFGLQLAKAPRAADDWSLTTGGGCRSVGVGGGLTGHSADCVTGDSEIATSRGRMSMAELCRLPEFPDVLSWDHDHGRAEFRAVQATQNVADRPVVEVATRVGRALRCTPDHRVYVPGRGYVPAGDLQRGDPLLGIDADDSVEQVRIGERETVYDLQVEGNQNFFADSLLVHNCLICDDPIQDREQAESLGQRDKIDDWWSSVAMTRLSPGAPAILILTRWNPDDQAARLLDREGRVEEGGRWKVIHIPAVANLDLTGSDVLGREDGAPLTHPKIASTDKAGLERHWTDKRNSVSMRDWHALFQGDPKPAEGQLVSPELLRARRHIPPDPAVQRQRYGVAVDPAAGGRDLAGVIGGWLGTDGRLYLSHDSSRNGYSTTWAREAALLCAEQEADFVIFEKSGLLDKPAIRTSFDSAWSIVRQLHAGTVEPDEFTDQEFLDRVRTLEKVPAKPLVKTATARKGKLLRAEPIAQQWADDRLRTSTYLVDLEGEWTSWLPTDPESPGRIDASVYLASSMLQIEGNEANVSVATAHTRDEVVMEAQRRQAQRRPAQPQMATRIQRPPIRPGG